MSLAVVARAVAVKREGQRQGVGGNTGSKPGEHFESPVEQPVS